jgi:DNA polymerase
LTALHFDIETFSRCDLKASGVYKYAEDPSTEIMCAAFAQGDGPVDIWIPAEELPKAMMEDLILRLAPSRTGMKIYVQPTTPEVVVDHIKSGGEVRAHNAQFERTVLNGVAGKKVGFPKIEINQVVCTAAKMAAHGLPRSLGEASKALGSFLKDDVGRTNMLALSKPRSGKIERWLPSNAPARFVQLYAYCIDDVKAERGIDHIVPDLSASELNTYRLDQTINDRGVGVDLPSVNDVQWLVDKYKGELSLLCVNLTGVEPTKREKIATWVRDNGFAQLADMQAETVKELIAREDVPDNVKQVLKLYSTYGMKAVTKYEAIRKAVCADGRLHGMFLYYGAGTGRWSSLIVQLQNLFRPVIENPDAAIDLFWLRDLPLVREEYPKTDPMKVFASCIRGMLVPKEDHDLMFLDFAGIESRVNAWLWGERWKLQAFRDYDAGTGPDQYIIAVADCFGLDPSLINKKDKRRQWGKAIDLFGGYEGGSGAFVTMADTYGVDLDELRDAIYPTLTREEMESASWMWEKFGRHGELAHDTYFAIEAVKQRWRNKHPKTKAGWKELKEASIEAVLHPGKVYKVAGGKILFSYRDQWLYMKLPSGRRLAYFRPSVDRDGESETLRYWGVDTKTRRYMKTASYGGKLCENAVQAISRDLLVHAMFGLEANGYPLVGSVHDEAIMEVLKNYGSIEHASAIMCSTPAWAAGLPVAVEGHRAQRYRK